MYQDTYQKLLNDQKLCVENSQSQQLQQIAQSTDELGILVIDKSYSIFLPVFQSKFKKYMGQNILGKSNNTIFLNKQDYLSENYDSSKNNSSLYNDYQQLTQQYNLIQRKQMSKYKTRSLSQGKQIQSTQILIRKFKNSQQDQKIHKSETIANLKRLDFFNSNFISNQQSNKSVKSLTFQNYTKI
ncbi:hypothetical protein ABPG72_001732 [Tetrahymena utriculariae]